jgi:ATP-binding cassette subfamily B protein
MLIYEGGVIVKKYPFVKQRGLKDCASACVQMILKYYNGYTSIEKLNEMMNTNQNGTTAYHMVEALKELGFDSYGLKLKDLNHIELPCIAHVIINNSYKHYIVIYNINYKKKTLLIADPSTNLKTITFKEFQKIWQNIIINMRPNRQIVCDKKPNTLKFIYNLLKPSKKLIIIIGLLSLLTSIFSIIASFYLPILIKYIKSDSLKICITFLIINIIKTTLTYLRNLFLIALNSHLDYSLSLDTFKQIINLPYRYFRTKTTGEITSYFNDLFLIKNILGQIYITLLINIPLIIFLSTIIFCLNIKIFIVLLIFILIYLLLYYCFKNRNYFLISHSQYLKSITNSYMIESIMGFETIKNLNIEKQNFENYKNKNLTLLKTNNKMEKLYNQETLLKDLIDNLNIFLVIFLALKAKNLNISFLITIYIFSSLLFSSVRTILDFDLDIKEIISAINHINELLINKPRIKIRKQTTGDININNLSYSFDKVNYVLKNINLKIKKGSKIMITGPSGSGKSTLFKIVKGYYNDYKGQVLINDLDIKQYFFDSLIYISQNEILFTGTLKDNLNIKTNYSNDVCELQSIGNTIIEENGFNLSGGQKQRIILARALGDFQTLIIDEGLSEVDINLERKIIKKLFHQNKDKTIIYISHRLDNLDLFERLIKLENGKVVLDETRHH